MAIFGSSGYRRRASSDPFTDLLFNALLGFTFLFLIAIMFMNPVAKKGIIDPKAEYIITITWADNNPDDVDTWVEDPNGNLIWFRNREAGLIHLDRDDRGVVNDTLNINGEEIQNPLNQEVITVRGVVPGEYVVNVHYYATETGQPLPVTVKVSKVNPALEIVYYGETILEKKGDEKTAVRFVIDKTGKVSQISHINKSLVGSVPRKAGMERADLLGINGKVFVGQGKAINDNAKPSVRVVVVGNPCNTNALIAMKSAPDIPNEQFFAMTRLDENRAKTQLAQKAGVPVKEVTELAIWGNHSPTMYPDFENAKIGRKKVTEVIPDQAWLRDTFVPDVGQRGKAIIEARGASSAASAANAVVDTVRDLSNPSRGEIHSVCVVSSGEYGTPAGIITSLPIRVDGAGKWRVVEGISLSEYAKEKIAASNGELLEEREVAFGQLGLSI